MANFLNRLFKKQSEEVILTDGKEVFIKAEILSPMKGRIIPLGEVSDPVFSQKMMGDGVAIDPIEGFVTSPIAGQVVMLFETNHAIGLKSEDGVEILIHVGMDTVELKGKGFVPHVKNGDTISAGDLLIEVDLNFIREAGYSTVTPIIVTNTADYESIETTSCEDVECGHNLLTVSN